MRVFHGFESLPSFAHPTATVGSYDGVHCGHRVLLQTTIATAQSQGGESIVLTFEPHPRVTLGKIDKLKLLTSLEEKIVLLEQIGIDNLLVIPFDLTFSRVSSVDFIRHYLIDKVGIETLIVGFNHHFGRGKEGNYDFLDHHRFGLHIEEVKECDVDSEKVSSTVIRKLIEQGDMARATKMLAHPYLIIGTAQDGQIVLHEPLKLLPHPGTYRVKINGDNACLTIENNQLIPQNQPIPNGKVIITF
ncbi:MAG: FAD synthetase [Alistipes sp.]